MLTRTEKAKEELKPGSRTLGQRERSLLLLADGKQDEQGLAGLFGGAGATLIEHLIEQGYLVRTSPRTTGAKAVPARQTPSEEGGHGDQFAGTRSLATARMFLFDISERMFARRDPVLAQAMADAREAREPAAMLAVGRVLISDIEALAGSSRADGISERLARLLPATLLEQAA
ncbi:MAG: hypothetical protein ACLGH2_06945 [Gammaproteobacteria bacterium]